MFGEAQMWFKLSSLVLAGCNPSQTAPSTSFFQSIRESYVFFHQSFSRFIDKVFIIQWTTRPGGLLKSPDSLFGSGSTSQLLHPQFRSSKSTCLLFHPEILHGSILICMGSSQLLKFLRVKCQVLEPQYSFLMQIILHPTCSKPVHTSTVIP